MGILDKLLGRDKNEDLYFDLLVELGQIVVSAPPRGVRLSRMVGVNRAADVLQNRRLELQFIEQAMEEEEQKVLAANEAEDREKPEHEQLVQANRAAILTLEKRLTALKKNLSARQANMRYFLRALDAQEKKIAQLEEAGEDEKAAAERELFKKFRLDRMRQERQLIEAEEEMAMQLQGEGRAGEGLRAKMRLEEIEQTQKEREEELNEILADLDRQATAKEKQIVETEEALSEALAEVGAEVYALRLDDPRYREIFAELDDLARKLGGG
ncbi:MAG: hypothetical protein ACOCVR_02575 [Myxococcota bacterium]